MDYWINSPIFDGIFPMWDADEYFERDPAGKVRCYFEKLYFRNVNVDWDELWEKLLGDLRNLDRDLARFIFDGEYWINAPVENLKPGLENPVLKWNLKEKTMAVDKHDDIQSKLVQNIRERGIIYQKYLKG